MLVTWVIRAHRSMYSSIRKLSSLREWSRRLSTYKSVSLSGKIPIDYPGAVGEKCEITFHFTFDFSQFNTYSPFAVFSWSVVTGWDIVWQ